MHWRLTKMINRFRTVTADKMFRKRISLRPDVGPIVSFTFDDFPISAAVEGATILERYGGRGTFYTSLCNLNRPDFFTASDLRELYGRGHEIGCHTYSHIDCWKAGALRLRKEVKRNFQAWQQVVPNAELTTFAYPYAHVPVLGKRVVDVAFGGARGGREGLNFGTVDANLLAAHTLFRSKTSLAVRDIILQAVASNAWLIFITHDVQHDPSPFGCLPQQLEDAVGVAVASGMRIMPVTSALQAYGIK